MLFTEIVSGGAIGILSSSGSGRQGLWMVDRMLVESRLSPLEILDKELTMIETVATALTALRAAVGLAKDALSLRDDTKMAEAKSALIDRLLDVQTACLSLQEMNFTLIDEKQTLTEEKRSLEAQLMEAHAHAKKLSQYERVRTMAGTLVFVDKSTKNTPDGCVYACASCMDEGKITTMQPAFEGRMLTCPIHGHVGLTQNILRVPFTHPSK